MNVNTYLLIFFYLIFKEINYSNAIDFGSFLKTEDTHENEPRIFKGIFSRPKPEAEKQHGIGLKEHAGNVLKGGSIGFQAEFRPLAPIHGLIDHAKKIIPIPMGGIKPSSVVPQGGKEPETWWKEEEGKKEEPIPDYNWKDPKKDEDTKSEDIESEDHYGWDSHDPDEKDKTSGSKWDEIGEGNEEYYNDHTTVPIEEIIQPRHKPRTRSKRRAESKVFYLPLELITNGKPTEVKIVTNDNEP